MVLRNPSYQMCYVSDHVFFDLSILLLHKQELNTTQILINRCNLIHHKWQSEQVSACEQFVVLKQTLFVIEKRKKSLGK